MVDEIYLDWNATSPPAEEVLSAMSAASRALWGNPASVHAAGRRARAALETVREQLAAVFDFFPRDVVFTGSGTEANNLALSDAKVLVTSPLEHPSVVEVAKALERRGRPVFWLPVPSSGQIDPGSVLHVLDSLPEPSLATVAVMAANHETGVLQPLREIAAHTQRVGARLHVDAVQLAGKGALASLAHASSLTITAHKLRGPKGIGALLFRGPAPPRVLLGGAQERGIRPGTVDVVAAVGFGAALARALLRQPDEEIRVGALRDQLELGLSGVGAVNGAGPRLAHVSNLSFSGAPGPEMVAALDLLGIRVASGSACSAGTTEPSAVISAMNGNARAREAVRFSLGEDTTAAAVERVVRGVHSVLART